MYKQNPIPKGYLIESELENVPKNGFYESLLGYDNVDWFLKEVIKLENKMAFYFKNAKEDIIMTEENEEDYRNNNICRFCEEKFESAKIRGHCHSTGKYRSPAQNNCNSNVTQ